VPVQVRAGDGFDWGDAGIRAATTELSLSPTDFSSDSTLAHSRGRGRDPWVLSGLVPKARRKWRAISLKVFMALTSGAITVDVAARSLMRTEVQLR
jgi:hypothetical protein